MIRPCLLATILLASSDAREIGKLKVLSLNTWGLPEPHNEDREARFHVLRDIVASHSDYDLVTLQEVWMHEDFDALRNATPYAADFR